jgi:3',5'-cyclic AMP phosphodiesterase CpdA
VPTEIPSRAIPMNNAIQLMNDLIGNASGSRTGNNVQFMIHTGDAKYAEADDDFSYFVNAVKKTTKPVYIVAGNHDVGNSNLVEKGMTDAQIYAQMVEPFLAKWSLKSDTTASDSNYVPCHIEGKNYYYTDYSEEKIRIIFLYEYETDFAANGNTLLYYRGMRAFRQEQIDWFVKSLLSTPEGYGVMVVKHQPENANGGSDNPFNAYHVRNAKGGQQTYVGLTMIADIVQAFIDGTSINRTYNQTGGVVTTLNVNADFSGKKANTEFIAYISGHTHNDSISVLKDYPRQLELNIGCCNTCYYGGSDVLHKPNDLSEDLINVYSIDRNRGFVYIVRIGADYTCMGQKRDTVAIKYRTDTV